MRLTEKKENGFYKLKEGQEIYGEEDGVRLVQIVGKFEDIEDELGIDLITLFKAGQQRYVFVKNAFGEINSRELYDIDIYTKIIVYYFEYQPERQLMHQHLNMYGKTWALTREELENE